MLDGVSLDQLRTFIAAVEVCAVDKPLGDLRGRRQNVGLHLSQTRHRLPQKQKQDKRQSILNLLSE